MKKASKKVLYSIKSAFGPVTLFTIAVAYLILGNIIKHYFGPKIANSLILSGPFYKFLLAVLGLTLIINLINKYPFKQRSWGVYGIHIGLVLYFLSSFITSFSSFHGELVLEKGKTYDYAFVDTYEVLISPVDVDNDKRFKVQKFLDLNFSIRPQGLSLDFGPVYLLSYLPFSKRVHTLKDVDGEVSAVLGVSNLDNDLKEENSPSSQIFLSTNNFDFPSFYSTKDGHSIYLHNEKMLNCLINLSNVNPSCAKLLQRRNIVEFKRKVCSSNNYIITNSGFISLANSCRLDNVQERIILNKKAISLLKYYPNKQFENNYHYVRDIFRRDTDVIKYYQKDSPRKVRFLKLNEKVEVINLQGEVFELSFTYKKKELPFVLSYLTRVDDKGELGRYLKVNGKTYKIGPQSIFDYKDYRITFKEDQLAQNEELKAEISYDKYRIYQSAGLYLFIFGLLIFGLQLMKQSDEISDNS